ncbi:MAG: glycolate oxidase subunit GlcE [Dongiaceae bacterium]
MDADVKATSIEQIVEAVRGAVADQQPLEIVGRGTKRNLGRPIQAGATLDLSSLSGIVSYEPAELILTCLAGTPLAEIEAALTAKNQQLAFEPGDWGPLYGAPAGQGTIGGVLACNLSGPRRLKAGAARDHFLGVSAVSGRGEIFKAGGKVVKNVTGYDLPKLLCGSYGTLAVMAEVTLKVLPAPEKSRTVLLFGLDDERAIAAMSAALNSPHEVASAAHLPARIAARTGIELVAKPGRAVTAIRIEGPGPSVEHRCAALRHELAAGIATEELHSLRSALFWRAVRDVAPLLPDSRAQLWRLSVPPAAGAKVMHETFESLRRTNAPTRQEAAGDEGDTSRVDHYYDWAGGLIWLTLPPRSDASATIIRSAIARHGGGHATLVRASKDVRIAVPVFEPQAEPLAALTARVKDSFDPQRILNPGRIGGGN